MKAWSVREKRSVFFSIVISRMIHREQEQAVKAEKQAQVALDALSKSDLLPESVLVALRRHCLARK